MEPIL